MDAERVLPPTNGPDRTLPSAWYALAVLVLTGMFAFLDRQILNLVVPALQRTLGLSDVQLGLLQGLGLALFACLAGYPMGWLADRFGRRLLLVIGIAIWSLSTAACAIQTSFAGLFICTIGIAVGEAGLTPIMFGLLPDLFATRERQIANVIVFGSGLLSAAIGLGIGGTILRWSSHAVLPLWLDGFEPWRLAMMAVALPAPLFMLLVATLPIGKHGERRGAIGAMAPFRPFVAAHRRTFVCVFGAIAGYNLTLSAGFAWLPLAAFRAFGLPPAETGMRMGGTMIAGAVAAMALPTVAARVGGGERTGRPLRIATGFALMGLIPTALFLAARGPDPLFAYAAAQFGLCLATAASMPGVVQDFSPAPLRSRILSLVTIVGAIAQATSSLAIGAISGLLAEPRGALLALAIVGAAGLASSAILLAAAIRPFRATRKTLSA